MKKLFVGTRNILSELPKRMARVTASGSPSLTSAAAFHTQDRSEPTLGDSFISGTTGRALLASLHTPHRLSPCLLSTFRYTYCSGWRRP